MSRHSTRSTTRLSSFQELPLLLLRLAVGWHLLYEGIIKLADPHWSAASYLSASRGPLAGVFQSLAANETVLSVVNQLNFWGLILIGGCLVFGLATRFAAASGILLLGLYYASNPPWIGLPFSPAAEGKYLLVNKDLIEMLALGVVFAFPSARFGLDGLFDLRKAAARLWNRQAESGTVSTSDGEQAAAEPANAQVAAGLDEAELDGLTRRQIMSGLVGAPVAGGLALAMLKQHGWATHEESQLGARLAAGTVGGGEKVDILTGATRTFNWASIDELKEKVPHGQLGDLKISRVILGGNLMGGWAHARDLIYVSKLIKAYHHREKVYETLQLAEACGINTILTSPLLCDVIVDYWKQVGGKAQFISDCGGGELLESIQRSIDNGAASCYVHGGIADTLVEKGDFDTIVAALELIRSQGLPAGVGAHYLSTVQGIAEKGIQPDYWMKTIHHTDYWSATPTREQDNIWCESPQETRAFMHERKEPWIAYKTLAAGAIEPEEGLRYAFESGADFVCLGMYDFQIVDDANIVTRLLQSDLDRERPWFA